MLSNSNFVELLLHCILVLFYRTTLADAENRHKLEILRVWFYLIETHNQLLDQILCDNFLNSHIVILQDHLQTLIDDLILRLNNLLQIIIQEETNLQLGDPIILGHTLQNLISKFIDIPNPIVLTLPTHSQLTRQHGILTVDGIDQGCRQLDHAQLAEQFLPLGHGVIPEHFDLVVGAVVDEPDQVFQGVCDVVQ